MFDCLENKIQMKMQSISRLLLILLFLFAHYSSTHADDAHYANCAPYPYTCGDQNFTISYPFRVDGRNDYCGYPNFSVNCNNDTGVLSITISNKDFQVTAIDYTNGELDLINTVLVHQSCPQRLVNTTIDAELFQFSNRNANVTFFINCSATSASIPNIYNLQCLYSITGQHSYYRVNNSTMDDVLGGCSSTVAVPMAQNAATQFEKGSVTFGAVLQEGFPMTWTPGMGWCSNCVSSGGRCGYNNTSTADHTCFCSNGTFIDSCSSDNSAAVRHSYRWKTILGICMGVAGFIIIGSLLVTLWCHSHKKISGAMDSKSIEALLKKYGSLALRSYTYSQVKKMTSSFSEKLGQGGYGTVFKGKLTSGHVVAVKVLNESKGNGEDFINEVAAIGRTSHVNVVTLLGFCMQGSKRVLIYDFMPNGSLDKYINYSEKATSNLSLGWEKLYEIAVGIARGLEYLHRGCNTRIVHFDIKPHNILLDQNLCPKLSDFGLAKLCPEKGSIISVDGVRGTIGYIAPEVFSRAFGTVSSKSDVYSYGMVLLEMFGGKTQRTRVLESCSETYFPQWIYKHLDQTGNLMDYGVTNLTEEIARKMMIVGFWCIQTMPEKRPSMTRVVEMLEGSINDLSIPPKPVLSSSLDFVVGSSPMGSSTMSTT